MLCFFMFLLMTTVSSAPMDLMSEKQASKSVTEMMSQPLLSQALLQNKTFLSELAKADPGTLNTIMGLLNDLLDASIAASIAFTTDVNTALIDKNAKTTLLASATTNQTNANNAKTAADSAFTKATSDFDAAVIHHTTMQDELTDKQPGVDAESDTLRRTIAIVRTLLPGYVPYTSKMCRGDDWSAIDQGTVSQAECGDLCSASQACTAFDMNTQTSKCYLHQTAVPVAVEASSHVTCWIKQFEA